MKNTCRLKRILRTTLIALSCTLLSGLDDVQAQALVGSISLQRWKSCAQLIPSDGGYSASDIESLFKRPQNIQQFLGNLKLAWERDLLLQPSFHDEVILRKFFDASEVSWQEPGTLSGTPAVKLIISRGGGGSLPKMTARVESNCSLTTYTENDQQRITATIFGFMEIEVASSPPVTLSMVRSVFGQESSSSIDRGVDPDGNTYSPVDKGSVAYVNPRKSQLEGSRVETQFYFKLGSPQIQGGEPHAEIVADDSVSTVAMRETTHRIVRKP